MTDYTVTVTKVGDGYSWSSTLITMKTGQTLDVCAGAGFGKDVSINAVTFYNGADKDNAQQLGTWQRASGTSPSMSGIASVAADGTDATKVTLTDLWASTTNDDDISFTVTVKSSDGTFTPDPELILKKQTAAGFAAEA